MIMLANANASTADWDNLIMAFSLCSGHFRAAIQSSLLARKQRRSSRSEFDRCRQLVCEMGRDMAVALAKYAIKAICEVSRHIEIINSEQEN
jgi:hypothetical protein